MVAAGDLRERIIFQSREDIDDGAGNESSGPWTDIFSCAAEMVAARGGERVEAGAQIGVQTWTVRVRDWSQTEAVTAGFRIVNARKPSQVLNVRSNVPLIKYPGFRELVADEGVAT